MPTTFNPGDVVKLKSGGPPMTVESRYDATNVNCVWFEGTNQKHGCFPDTVLKPATSTRGSRVVVV